MELNHPTTAWHIYVNGFTVHRQEKRPKLEAWIGLAPTWECFADICLTIRPSRHVNWWNRWESNSYWMIFSHLPWPTRLQFLFKLVLWEGFEPSTLTLKVWYSFHWIIRALFLWQAVKESNLYQRFWRPLCYHYTNNLYLNWWVR